MILFCIILDIFFIKRFDCRYDHFEIMKICVTQNRDIR